MKARRRGMVTINTNLRDARVKLEPIRRGARNRFVVGNWSDTVPVGHYVVSFELRPGYVRPVTMGIEVKEGEASHVHIEAIYEQLEAVNYP